MRRSKRLGFLSFLSGIFAIGAAAAAVQLRAIFNPATGAVLAWLEKIGLVKHSQINVPSVSEAGFFSVNDENAILWLMCIAVFFAVAAMVLAVIAEWRREPSLFLSAGYVCGALATALIKPVAGFAYLVFGIAAIMVLRHERKQKNT